MNRTRIVVTGMGLISPVGNTVAESWDSIKNGRSGIGDITLFDTTGLDLRYAGEVKGFDPVAIFGTKEAKRTDRAQQFALVAAEQALRDSGVSIDDSNSYDVGVIIGSGIGGINTLAEQLKGFYDRGRRGVSPVAVPQLLHDGISSRVSMHFGLRGPNYNITTACATGNNSIGDAADYLRMGRANVMLAGASEACINPMVLSGFYNMTALARREYPDPTLASRPFDKEREGFVAGEGGALIVLERLEDALARGARIYAEITGYGHTSDAYHVTAPREDGAGAAEAMRRALKDAGITAEQLDYINAHGTGTPLNDKSETAALKLAFGETAYRIPISSTKSMTGHMQGATGAAETIFSIMAIQDNFVPPTINLTTPDPECDLDYTPNVGRAKPVNRVLNYTAGFGGHNVALVIERYQA